LFLLESNTQRPKPNKVHKERIRNKVLGRSGGWWWWWWCVERKKERTG